MLHLAFLSFIRRPLTRLILLFLIALACALPVFLLQTAGSMMASIVRSLRFRSLPERRAPRTSWC